MGAATANVLRESGQRVIGIDLRDADVVADLATPTGRRAAVDAVAGIRLNAIAPGLVETPFVEETRNDEVLGGLIDQFPIPLGRGGRAEEIADLTAFLLGGKATFFCGAFLVCDGGTEALLRPDD